jgi:L-aspartate oxidase
MEFVQFHPTVLYIAGSSRHLLTEAIRGEGAFLRDCNGVRFMPEAHPLAELAPRDDVSRAIVAQMALTNHPNVYLDLSHLDPERVRRRFPSIDEVCRGFGLDITRDPIPVRPGAHYMIGGVTVDPNGKTTLPGLWAAGEVTSSGLHGANRLASNSLLEGLVYGARAAESIAASLGDQRPGLEVPPIEGEGRHRSRGSIDLEDLREALRSLMWRKVGISREEEGLDEAKRQLQFWSRYLLDAVFPNPEGWELQNMVTVASLMIQAARLREESRGTHWRSDFPRSSDSWERQIAFLGRDLRGS